MKTIIIFFLFTALVSAQIRFSDYFLNKTLRIDCYHTGTKDTDYYSFDQLKEEPYWGGSKTNLLDKFNYGEYEVKAFDSLSNKLIFSHTYSTLFHEWQTTQEARQTTKTFSETVTMPFPKNNIYLEFYSRDKKNNLIKKFTLYINSKDYYIRKDNYYKFPNFKVQYSGDPANKVDIVIIPDGYTKDQMNKFKDDCQKFAGYLFATSPYKENKDKFNIWGIEAPSEQSGTDIPRDSIWRNTLLNTNFYTFREERYLMTEDDKKVRDVASNAPYDQINILVNTDKYGGGAIYNYYSVCTADNKYSDYVFTHEFGHGFAFLADEYYTSDVTYINFYPLDVEPLEPNITTLVDFSSKWKDLVDKDTPIPTPDIPKYKNQVGAFEGGGYEAKGVYRPMEDCSMKSISFNNFCPVCKRAIQRMIDFYTE